MDVRLATGSFYGQTLKSLHAGGWGFTESVYWEDTQIPSHTHESAFFYLVVAGVCSEVYGRRKRLSESASLVFHPAGETHSNYWHSGEGRCFHIEIASTRLTTLREQARIIDSPTDFQGGPPVWLAMRLYREFRRMDDLSPLAMEGLTLELLAEASRKTADVSEHHPPRWLRQAQELLHARFRETLSLDEVAAAVGVHPSHLARVFHQQYRCTPGDYVRRLRIECACRQLSASDLSLLQIALDLGFSDQSHFCKTFKHLMDMTPGEFRKCHWASNSDTNR